MADEHDKTGAAQMRTLILCLLCTFGLVAGWTLEPQGGAPYGSAPQGWFGGVIPYVVDERMSDDGKRSAQDAMAVWTEATVLRFVPRTDEPDFIYFTDPWGNCVYQPSCVPVGRWLPNDVHGVGHGLRLSHEQQRRDRDRYIRVFQENISPHHRGENWNPGPFHGADISPYNYQSVMHYGFLPKRNRRGGPPALKTIPPHMPAGQIARHITPGDADTVARMFGLTPTSWTVSTNPLGLTVIVDGEEVITPAVFDWTPGSEHTLSVLLHPQVRPGSRYRFGRWSDADAAGTRTVTATSATTLYEANFVAAHRISTRVRPEGAGTVTISPDSSGGYYPLRSEVTMSAEPTAGSGFRFLRWEIRSDYLWQWLVIHETHGHSGNPARTYAMPGLEYTAVFTQGPILRVESNADPTTVEINGNEYRTPVALEARSLPDRVTVSLGKDYLEHEKGYRDRFHSWSDGGDEAHAVTVSRTEDTILELTVDTEHRLVTEAWQGWHGNEVLVTPPSEDGFYPEGTEVRLRAVSKPPAKFIGWNGDVSGRNPVASVVMDGGKLAEAVFALEARELQSSVPVEVSLRWNGNDLDFERYYMQVPPEASELEVQFSTRTATSGAEAGLFLGLRDIWPDWIRHENAHRILRGGVETITVPRPPDGWPAAYSILIIRATESDGAGARSLEGTLVARVRNRPAWALENPQPGSYQSGIGVIFGWVCEAERIEIEIQHGTTGAVSTLTAGYGTNRGDTIDVCDNDGNNGFSLAVNWNLLGAGRHTVRALADGEEFARRQVTVGTLGAGEFPTGLAGTFVLPDFPGAGQETSVRWEESLQNFVILGTE